jgi:protocatechuate 3,4-dioxygenase, alpha subunit
VDKQILTPSQTAGPLFGYALLWPGSEATVAESDPAAVRLGGQIFDGDGNAVGWPETFVEVWASGQLARTRTDREGAWEVVVARPDDLPPLDGRAQAPHLDIAVFGRGFLRHLVTRAYFPDEQAANDDDPVLSLVAPELRERLIARSEEGRMRFDIHLQGERESVFFAL